MRIKYIYNIIVILLSTVFTINAKTVVWSVKPIYENIKPYQNNLYLCQSNGKWGIIDNTGKIILPTKYDFITKSDENIGIYGILQNQKYKLDGFVYSEGTTLSLKQTLYIIPSYTHISEGKLCVEDSKGKQGFIDKNGAIVVKCQFDRVRPFCENLASIQKGPWVFYIREDYDNNPKLNVIYSKWRDGQVTRGSSFKNGKAVVGYNGKYRVIDKEGKELKEFKASLWEIDPTDYTIIDKTSGSPQKTSSIGTYNSLIKLFKRNEKIGFKCNNDIFLEPTLDDASKIDENQISIARFNGKYGLLKVIDESFKSNLLVNGNILSNIKIDTKGEIEDCQITLTIPKVFIGHSTLLVDNGDGLLNNVSSKIITNSNTLSYYFKPNIKEEDKLTNLRFKLLYEGLELYEFSKTLVIKRPIILRVSDPISTTEQADIKTEIQYVSSTIFNDSEEDASVTAILTAACKLNKSISKTFNIEIPAQSYKTVSIPIKVSKDEKVNVTIRLNSGEEKTSAIFLKIY